MNSKNVTMLAVCTFCIVGVILTTRLYYLMQVENTSLHAKLESVDHREKRIAQMERTMTMIYGISKYEAHYYSVIFDDFSQKDSVPWEAYPSLVRIESNFNPTLISPAKCRGLLQVSEGTGRKIAADLGIAFNEVTLWNDFLNVVIGLTYFNEGYKEAIGKMTKEQALKHAFQRYCGGPGYARVNPASKTYVGEYRTTIWQEYVRLSYIYKGILYDELVHAKPLEIISLDTVLEPATTILEAKKIPARTTPPPKDTDALPDLQ